MNDAIAVALGVISALVLLWGSVEATGYLLWSRRGRPLPGPPQLRLRFAWFAVAIVLGGLLGLGWGAWWLARAG